jgi:hypothetical protein
MKALTSARYSPSRRSSAPTSPGCAHASASLTDRQLLLPRNWRRFSRPEPLVGQRRRPVHADAPTDGSIEGYRAGPHRSRHGGAGGDAGGGLNTAVTAMTAADRTIAIELHRCRRSGRA